MNGRMIMAMNIHREICGAVMGGGVSLESDQVHVLLETILIFKTENMPLSIASAVHLFEIPYFS